MKKIKNYLLSVLLFAFTFLVIHDFVIDNINGDTKYERSYSLYETQKISTQSILDKSSQTHESVHTIFDTLPSQNILVEVNLFHNNPQTKEVILTSRTHFIPQRPPLV